MINYKNIYVVPVYHGRLSFTIEVRKMFARINPDAVAVELPDNLRRNIIDGVKRLPKLSMVLFHDELIDELLFVPIEPADPFIEVLRLSIEHNISNYLIDMSVKAYNPKFFALPDDYAVKNLGLDKFYDVVRKSSPEFFHLDEERFGGFPESFFTEGLEIDFIDDIDEDSAERDDDEQLDPKDRELSDEGDSGEAYGLFNDINERTKTLDQARDYYMACNLESLMGYHEKILLVVGMGHWERIKGYLESDGLHTDVLKYSPEVESELYNIPSKSEELILCLNEIPYNVYQWERFRRVHPLKKTDGSFVRSESNYDFDKTRDIPKIVLKAETEYYDRYQEQLSIQNSLQYNQYLRNLVYVEGRLTPEVYHLVTAAKNVIDDDFAWYVYKTAMHYPYAVESDSKLQTLDVKRDKVEFKGRMIKIRRRVPIKGAVRKLKITKVREPKEDEDWDKEWDDSKDMLCSYPEEDIILEERYQYIRQVARKTLTQKFTKVHEFKGSFMDGVDIRETVRNWINGQRIYVKETRKLHGDITSIIMIFDDEPLPPRYQPKSHYWDEKYPHNINFYAEHEEESDLAFFATTPGTKLVGPGISIIKIGGFLSEYPPRSWNEGYFEIFSTQANSLFRFCAMKSERLLLGAIYWSGGRYIMYTAKKRPRNFFYRIAHANNKDIIFIPLSTFSRKTKERLKYMHVLAGKFRRKYAHRYIDLKKRFKF